MGILYCYLTDYQANKNQPWNRTVRIRKISLFIRDFTQLWSLYWPVSQ